MTPYRAILPAASPVVVSPYAAPQTIAVASGDDLAVPFACFQPDGLTPLDLTGWTLTFIAKLRPEDPDTAAVVSQTLAVTAATQGQAQLSLTAAQTAPLAGFYVALLRAVSPTGQHVTLWSGLLLVRRS